MILHNHPEEFNYLVSVVAQEMHLPESAIRRDYYIVLLLQNLSNSEYADKCVFKGGTSLSKCYPRSIERFSEDIDLTFMGMELPDKECSRIIKRIEDIMTASAKKEKIPEERSNRSKSMYVWYDDERDKIKLEIGSNILPNPFEKKTMKSYIHQYLESHGGEEDIELHRLEPVTLNVLNIERTFIDKLMAVKRHAICGTLSKKVRHIYDVYRLYNLPEIKSFLENRETLKRIIRATKNTDSFYMEKRSNYTQYNSQEPYAFDNWRHRFTPEIKDIYESMHKDLLFTDEQQMFVDAERVFNELNILLQEIGE